MCRSYRRSGTVRLGHPPAQLAAFAPLLPPTDCGPRGHLSCRCGPTGRQGCETPTGNGHSSPTRAMSFVHAIRDVSWERGFPPESQQSPAACESLCFPMFPMASAVPVRRSGTIQREGAVVAMPVFLRRRHEIDYTIEKLKR